MTFLAVVVRGLIRRPVRTGLTLVGISIGIAAVVALVGMSRGFVASWSAGMKSRDTDIVIHKMRGSLTPKPFPASAQERIKHLPGVAATCAILVEFMSIEDSEMMIVSAREWGGFAWDNLEVLSGRLPRDASERVVVLGKTAAEVLGKKVGDTLQLETEELAVTGIVDGGAFVENGSVILALPLLQEISGNQAQINAIDVRVTPGTSEEEMQRLCAELGRLIPEARAQAAGEHIRHSQGYRIINAMSWGTSLLAVFVGVLGVMNTMLMTVFERKQEICILLALGWKRSRIVRMVLWESAMLGLGGGIVGVALGLLGVNIMKTTPVIRGLLEPEMTISLMLMAVAIAVVVGVVSGLYPAWRSSRLMPSLALQG
ncbi:MAG: ABC transporter permease [Verrucomicrobiota bacterium]|nr:ABC transporter permease [Verrucomicrobiota bacterium]